LRELTRAHGLLLIVDEIQTGMGRTGKLFHYEHAGIDPDIMTLGKGIGGGVPLAALLAKEAASCFEHGDQGGTFNGNPLCAPLALPFWRRSARRISSNRRPKPAFIWKANCSGYPRAMVSAKFAAGACCWRWI
jgi:adenosylmethionine-8-amino-7-oxononanoate aminotransferase